MVGHLALGFHRRPPHLCPTAVDSPWDGCGRGQRCDRVADGWVLQDPGTQGRGPSVTNVGFRRNPRTRWWDIVPASWRPSRPNVGEGPRTLGRHGTPEVTSGSTASTSHGVPRLRRNVLVAPEGRPRGPKGSGTRADSSGAIPGGTPSWSSVARGDPRECCSRAGGQERLVNPGIGAQWATRRFLALQHEYEP